MKHTTTQPETYPVAGATEAYHAALAEGCAELGVELTWRANEWLAELSKPGVATKHFIMGYKFDLNAAAASLLADDKCATFEVLSAAGVPAAEHQIFYAAGNPEAYAAGRNSLTYLEEYFERHQQNVVLKPNCGMQGSNVYHVTERAELAKAAEQVLTQGYAGAIGPFYPLQCEYRVVMLDGVARLIFQKARGADWRFNLRLGASAHEVTDVELINGLTLLAQQAVRALGLRFCSVDVVETASGERMVLEVNSGVSINHFLEQQPASRERVRAIYRDAVAKMFTE